MTDTGRDTLPRLPYLLQDVFRAAHVGWMPERVFLAWIALMLIYLMGKLPETWLVDTVCAALAAAILLAVATMIAGSSGWEYGRQSRWTLRQSLALLRRRALSIYIAVLSVVLVPALFLAILTFGCFLLGLVPSWLGRLLSSLWLIVAGVPLGVFGAAFLSIGVPASLLMVPAAALDFPDAFDAVSRSMSYVRARPLKYAVFLGVAAVSGLWATFVTAVFVLVISTMLVFAYQVGTERAPLDIGDLGATTITAFDFEWALASEGREGLEETEAGTQPQETAGPPTRANVEELPALVTILLVCLGRLLPASFFAALVAALARTYLCFRWELDDEPPSSLVRYDETFQWATAEVKQTAR